MTANDICFLTATEMAKRIRDKELSAREVMSAHLEQIARVNPKVNAIVTQIPDEDALKLAEQADRAVARGDDLGTIHGLPIAHKDLVATKGMRTTFGSPLFKDFVPEHDHLIVERLKGGRCAHDRQDQRAGVRRRFADLQPGLRRDAQPLRHEQDVRRQQWRRGGGAGLRDDPDC